MGPEYVAVLALGVMSLSLALIWSGWALRGPEVELQRDRAARAEAALEDERARATVRARGAEVDLALAADRAAAVAAGDGDRVLRSFPDRPDPAPGESDS